MDNSDGVIKRDGVVVVVVVNCDGLVVVIDRQSSFLPTGGIHCSQALPRGWCGWLAVLFTYQPTYVRPSDVLEGVSVVEHIHELHRGGGVDRRGGRLVVQPQVTALQQHIRGSQLVQLFGCFLHVLDRGDTPALVLRA